MAKTKKENQDENDVLDATEITDEASQEPVSNFRRVTADAEGQSYLPGNEPLIIPELNETAIQYDTVKKQRMKLLAQEVELKGDLGKQAKKYSESEETKHFFREEANGAKVYSAAGVTVTINHEEKETVTAKIETVSATVEDY